MTQDQQPEKKMTIQDSFEDFDIIDDDELSDETIIETVKPQHLADGWVVMVIDDDEEVHSATRFALKNVEILGKQLILEHAYSAVEGFKMLQENAHAAVILLDVVMESEDAGLELVKKIRKSGATEVRIILRTGQPGYAPEMSVLRDYDINDYRAKSELTRDRLISVLTTSIRSYRQIHTINESRRGLDLIIQSSKNVFKRNSLELFAQGVLIQIISLLGIKKDGIVCLFSGIENQNADKEQQLIVITATGRFKSLMNKTLDAIDDESVKKAFFYAQQSEIGVYIEKCLGLYFSCNEHCKMFIYVEESTDFSEEHITLLKVFASNISISFENIALIERLDQLAYIDTELNLPNRNALIVAYQKIVKEHSNLHLAQIHINAISHAISVFGIAIINKIIVKIYKTLEATMSSEYLAVDNKSNILMLFDPNQTDIMQIEKLFQQHFEVDGIQLLLTTNTSIVPLDSSMEIDKALRYAMSTITFAKHNPGNNIVQYTTAMSTGLKNRVMLQSQLRQALEQGGLIKTYLQPKVDCKTGKLIGAEALSRWQNAGHVVTPDTFIPIAEASGLASHITDTTLQALSQYKEIEKSFHVPVAINLSIYEIRQPDFAVALLDKLKQLNLTPQDIEFEITESAMIKDPEKIVSELWKIRESGYSFAIDDFGTGYSSLRYLEQLPVNSLKIDKHFISSLTNENAQHSIVASAISIAEKLNIKVISEGVETIEQYNALISLGCDACQGYYFGKAVPLADFKPKYESMLH